MAQILLISSASSQVLIFNGEQAFPVAIDFDNRNKNMLYAPCDYSNRKSFDCSITVHPFVADNNYIVDNECCHPD
jgi:hypothetical protein